LIFSQISSLNIQQIFLSCSFIYKQKSPKGRLSKQTNRACKNKFTMTKVFEINDFWKRSEENLPGEVWLPIDGYAGYYSASSFGRIKSIGRMVNAVINGVQMLRWSKGKIIKQKLESNGYLRLCISIDGKTSTVLVHRLVAAAFFGASKLPVNHKDFNRSNNCVENLEYMTYSENVSYSYMAGRLKSKVGSKNQMSKLSESNIPIIKSMFNELGQSIQEIAAYFNVNYTTISNVINGKSWSHVLPDEKVVDKVVRIVRENDSQFPTKEPYQ
jgi:hypothetical protein